MSDDCLYGNLPMFSVCSWHFNRSCCMLICGDNKCYKCMRWVIRKSLNYRGGPRYKSCRLEAGCIRKTICKLNTWYFRGPVVEVLDSRNVKTWHGRLSYQSQAESAWNWGWWMWIHYIGRGGHIHWENQWSSVHLILDYQQRTESLIFRAPLKVEHRTMSCIDCIQCGWGQTMQLTLDFMLLLLLEPWKQGRFGDHTLDDNKRQIAQDLSRLIL